MRLGLPGIVARAEAQIFVETIRLDELARIHLPIGIPKRLELAESLHEFRPEHLRKKFGAGLAVSMFAGERAAVADDEVGGLFHELAEFAHALCGFEIVVHARVHAGVAEVSVERAVVVEGLHQLAQLAEVGAEFLGRDRGIFEAFPAQRFAGHVRSHAQARLADIPDAARLARIDEEVHVGRSGGAVENFHQVPRLGFGLVGRAGAELDHQPASAFRQHARGLRGSRPCGGWH